ncbi:zinc-binding dehydrogenase [Gordonia sp. ABKF26]|uniref:zinc-binding dehydrogenase n=1 Tax=Gordonia sp. ABKF26 TaxID=3238687 RepID=UPI0034E41171
MSEVTATALHAINRAGDVAGRTVGIIGGGPIGITAALCAQRAGAGSVAISEVSASRRTVLESLGIASVVGALEPNSVDVCVDAAGEQATQAMSITALRPGGRAVWVGIHGDDVVLPFGSYSVVVGERDVIGSFAYDDDEFATAVELSADWNWSWVTSVPLEEAAATFTALRQGSTDIVKVHFVSGVR